MVPVSLFALYFSNEYPQLSDQPPVQWEPFTYVAMEKHIADDRPVIMFGKPNYHGGGEVALKTFDDNRIRHAAKNGEFVPMILEYDDWSGAEIKNLFTKFGQTKYPIAMLFRPDGQCIKIDPYSASDVLEHIPGRSSKRRLLLWLAVITLVIVCIITWKLRPVAKGATR